MEELPIPLSRVELYLAKAAGMDVTPPEPKSRLELFLAKIAGMDVEMPAPLSLIEMWLAQVAGSAPIEPLAIEGAFYIDNQKVDVRYLAVASGVIGATLPARPQNRKEQYWAVIASGGPIVGVLKYVTGTNITLTDVVRGIEELQFVYGDTYQQTYSGKNLFDKSNYIGAYRATYTELSNGLKATATATGGAAYVSISIPNSDDLLGKTARLSVGNKVSHDGSNLNVVVYQSSGGSVVGGSPILTLSGTTKEGTCTFPSSYSGNNNRFVIIFYCQSDTVNAYSEYTDIQLELGSSTTSFEPYTGGIPAPNPDYPQPIQVVTGEQNVWVHGKNMFDKDSPTVRMSFNTDKVFIANYGEYMKIVPCQPNTTYSIRCLRNNTYARNNVLLCEQYPEIGDSFIQRVALSEDGASHWKRSFTTTATTHYLAINIANSSSNPYTADEIFASAQLELGEESTAYEPYQGQSYTIDLGATELCKIGDYQDYIYKSGDDWYVHKEVNKNKLAGSGWVLGLAGYPVYYTTSITDYATSNNVPFCAIFSGATNVVGVYGARDLPNNSCAFINVSGDTTPRFYINSSKFADASELNTFLANNDTYIYYASATPTDTKITDSTLVGQLNAIDSAVLPKPIAYITVGATDPNLPAPLKISYYGRSA